MRKPFFSKRTCLVLTLMLFSFSFMFNVSFAAEKMTAEEEGVVKFKLKTTPNTKKAGNSNRYFVKFKAKPGKSEEAMIKKNGATIRHKYKLTNAFAIKVPNANAANAIQNNPNVEYIEMDSKVYAFADLKPWGVTAVRAPQTWGTTTGVGVNVCVLDSGIDYNHPELNGVYKGGYDFVNDDNDPMDDNGHGTHCAGTIAAEANNDGIIGVSYNANIYACKVLNAEGSGYSSDILAAVEWAVNNGMDIASMSLGGGMKSRTAEQVYQNAYNAGLLIICASGNDGNTRISYPAKYSSNVAVGAIDSNLVIADFSNTGKEQEVVAPGVAVKSTVPMGTGFEVYVQEGTNVYSAYAMEFAGETTGITATAYYCGLGESSSDFPAGVNGNIALIQRGNISFADKVTNAMNAGAAAVIIYNNETGPFGGTLGSEGNWVPTVSMSMEDGELLKALGTPTVTVVNTTGDYDSWDGTSMACPHVSAVAALVLAKNPALTNVDIRNILNNTATDLGNTGFDNIYGNGIVNAEAAVIAAGGGGNTNNPPVADFTFSTSELTVTFTDESSDSDGSISSWTWNFGDGNSSDVQNPTHTYAAAGTYTVSLTVVDNDGDSHTTSQDVTVTTGGGGSDIVLSANSYKVKGTKTVELSWNGAIGSNVNIYRNGALVATVANNGSFSETLGKGGGTYIYKICETDGSVCSNEVTVDF